MTISCSNSEIQSFTSLSKRYYEDEDEESQEVKQKLRKTETFLKGMKLEYIVNNSIKRNISEIKFKEKPHIMFYLLDEEKIKQVHFYHKLNQNIQISNIFIKAEKLRTKYKNNKLCIKKKLKEYENEIKQKMGEKNGKNNEEKIATESNSSLNYEKINNSELMKIDKMIEQIEQIERFVRINDLIVPDFLPLDFFKKIFSFKSQNIKQIKRI